jgi:hypothetical protein
MSTLADQGRNASTIGRKAAIGHRHKLAGIDLQPTEHKSVRVVLRGIRRTLGTATKAERPSHGVG